jgi:hypothetical protein
MVVDPETGIKKNNRIRLTGATTRNDAIKAMYDVLKGIKDGEIASTRSAPDFKTFREHYNVLFREASSKASQTQFSPSFPELVQLT